ncbi:MAG: hypothetical protein ACTSQU_17770 [Promethearchaeota archaeon]
MKIRNVSLFVGFIKLLIDRIMINNDMTPQIILIIAFAPNNLAAS